MITIADYLTFDFLGQIYEDLAWAGLVEDANSIAWNNLTTEEQERIKSNLLNIFHNGTKNCN
jgi:predicted small integral membrane protein